MYCRGRDGVKLAKQMKGDADLSAGSHRSEVYAIEL